LRYILPIIISILYIGCGGNSSSSFEFYLHNLFLKEYFWSDKISKKVDYEKYNTPQEMIDDLKYKPIDRWSMVITKEENNNFLNQKSGGFGFSYSTDKRKEIVVLYTRINSPAYKAGLQRGDIILTINNNEATVQEIQKASADINTTSSFEIYRASSDKNLQIDIKSQEYTFEVTKASTVTSEKNETVGYMRFDSFTATATTEIDKAFDYFTEQNIKKLIIDLRYNGGGSVVTASILLDKLTRDRDEEIQFKLEWNSNMQNKNKVGRFETDNNSIDLDTIIFLTTKNSASASELVINAMKPYLGDNIVTIGKKTHGKPVGMEGRTDGRYIYYLVNFVISNRDGFYDYFDGLEVTAGCEVEDDLTHQRGDIEEGMLKEALFYIDNGYCS
jgi:C-terminal peptidase prc